MGILIGTPCYGGLATVPFIDSCYFLKKELDALNIRHDFLRIRNESLITRARNVIASDFLGNSDYTALLFIDADIEFSPADVARLWNMVVDGAGVAVGHYRHKNPHAKDDVWVDHKLVPLSGFRAPFAVTYAGTGFMMIPRSTFVRLQEEHPDWLYQEGFPDEERPEDENIRECWAFFQDPVEDGFHLSEDYFFCKRVQELGLKVMMDPDIQLKHWGQYAF